MKTLARKSWALFPMLLGLILVGCADGSQFSPVSCREDAALVYVYRPKQTQVFAGIFENISAHRIYINGKFSMGLRNGGYGWYFVSPGTNVFGSSPQNPYSFADALGYTRNELLRTNFEAGKPYYLRFSLGAFGPHLNVVDAVTGENEIKRCRLDYVEQ